MLGNIIYYILYPFYRTKGIMKKIYIILPTIIILLFLLFYFYQYSLLKNERKPKQLVESIIIIKKGSSLNSISRTLKNSNIINIEWRFKSLAALKGASTKLKSGRYRFNNKQSIDEILSTLVKGSVFNNRIRIPEGIRSWEIASLLKQKINLDSVKFMEHITNKKLIKSLGIKANTLEGYLFPDTYMFPWDASASSIIRQMVGMSKKEYKKHFIKNNTTNKYTMHQIYTMASIVEAEAGIDKERTLISGVFYSRLTKGMTLGADPTVRFALKKFRGSLKRSELRINSPYNTRRFRGLPPGPIGNPGSRSIRAAILPDTTGMLYFVAKDDGTKEHFFTPTNNDHIKMKKVAALNRKKRKVTWSP